MCESMKRGLISRKITKEIIITRVFLALIDPSCSITTVSQLLVDALLKVNFGWSNFQALIKRANINQNFLMLSASWHDSFEPHNRFLLSSLPMRM